MMACKQCVRLAKESVIHQVSAVVRVAKCSWPSLTGECELPVCAGPDHRGSSSTGFQPPFVHCFVII